MDAHQILRTAGAAMVRMNVGHGAMKTVERVVAATLKSGTGTPIAVLKGIARSNAVRAALGLGSKANGGYGVAGGKKVLAAIWFVANLGFSFAVGLILDSRWKQMAKGENIASCLHCRTLLSVSERGDLQECPNCEPGNPAGT